MKNTNVMRVADALDDIRRWIKREVSRNPKLGDRDGEIDEIVQRVCLIAIDKLGKVPEDLGEARVKRFLWEACRIMGMKHRYKLFVEIQRSDRQHIVELEIYASRGTPNEETLSLVLRSAWWRMNADQRKVLRMWIDGSSWYEIANALGVGPGWVFARRKEIMALLKDHEGRLCGFIPLGWLRSPQTHPISWTVGSMTALAIVVVVLWLVGREDVIHTEPPTSIARFESPPSDAEPVRRGGRGPQPPTARSPATLSVKAPPSPDVALEVQTAMTEAVNSTSPTTSTTTIRGPGPQGRHPRGTNASRPIVRPEAPPQENPQELEVLRNARLALEADSPGTALKLLRQHRVDFPASTMAKDRMRLEHRALCELGDAEAAAIVERTLRTYQDPGELRCDIPPPPTQPNHRTQTR